jgi:hypothetical protein
MAWTAANAVMLLLFLFSAAVQLNDPDPLVWIPVYLAAAAICAIEITRRTRVLGPVVIALGSIVWASTIAPRVVGKVGFMDMFGAWEMQNIGIEEEREMYGLVIVALWMLAISVAAWRRKRA